MAKRFVTIAVLLSVLAVSIAKKKNPQDDMVDLPMQADASKGEMDALSQAMGSDKLQGKTLTGRKISKDGKSGMLQFGNPNGEREHWTPKFTVSERELRSKIGLEDFVLAYFFTTESDDHLQESHANGKKFEEAAQELLEGEDETTLVMVDLSKNDRESLRELGVTKPHQYRIFINGKSKEYRGSTEAKGIVYYMNQRTGPPSTKIETSEALDELLGGNGTATMVVGVFGPAYEGNSARQIYTDAARDLRDAARLHFFEASTYVARGSKRLAKESFDTSESALVVHKPAKWIAKNEAPYALSTDFRSVHRFVREHSWPTVGPLSDEFVAHAKEKLGKDYMAIVLVDTRKQAKFLRYVVKQLHKLLDADESIASKFSIAVANRRPLDSFIAARFDRTTIDRQFFQLDKFESEYVADFTLIVADLNDLLPPFDPHGPPDRPATRNWATNVLAKSTPDSLDVARWVPFLQGILSGEIAPLAQGDAAAGAAGLKEMKMGFGDNGMEEVGAPKKKKKKKKKDKAPKEEV